MSAETYTPEELATFKDLQKLAYQAAQTIEKELFLGITEKQAATMLETYLKDHGVQDFFHLGFAWFGPRSGFQNFTQAFNPFSKRNPKNLWQRFSRTKLPHLGHEFQPSNQKLSEDMCGILDIAPIKDNFTVDIGYAFCFGENLEFTKAKKYLLTLRKMILDLAKQQKPINEIYQAIESALQGQGYKNCHGQYPFGVLGHKVGKIKPHKIKSAFNFLGFRPHSFQYILGQAKPQLPLIYAENKNRLDPGLWAIEPHIGTENFGVKFEEILVVTQEQAYWLDDELPHNTFT